MSRRTLPSVLAALLATTAAAVAGCPPAADLTAISVIQGRGDRSPLQGRAVRVDGVVTAVFAGAGQLGGFFLQERHGDGDPSTSDALFVRLPRGAAAPAPGDAERVSGTVLETATMTQLGAVTRRVRCGREPLPAPPRVRLPLPAGGSWEALEGMLVSFAVAPVITGVYQLGRYGELTLADSRLFAAGQGMPGRSGRRARRIVLDDGSRRRDPRPLPYLLADGTPPRVGDTVHDLLAVVVGTAPGSYRLEPVRPPTLFPSNPRPAAPASVGGDLRVASFNVHNFFTSLHERGARSAPAYALQRAKLVSALALLDADVLALQEVENDGMRSENALLRALDARLGSAAYAAVPDPASGVGSDRIKQALLYRPAKLELLSTASTPSPLFERAPLAATFRTGGGAIFTLLDIHLKSKGGCPTAGDVDRGYGCWNLRRSAQAQAVLDFAASLQRTTGSPDVLVAGDFNSYAREPPLRPFAAAGYRSAAALVPPASRYSYVYAGASGTLDYLLASPSLASRLSGATYWHIDADESPVLAAGTRPAIPGLARPDAYRASDHDPLLLGIALPDRRHAAGTAAR